jgi:hypothetical protein
MGCLAIRTAENHPIKVMLTICYYEIFYDESASIKGRREKSPGAFFI